MGVLTVLLYIILFLFPFGELLRFDLGNSAVIKPIDIVVGITALFYLIYYLIKKPKEVSRNNLLTFSLFPIAAAVSLLANITWLEPNEFFIAGLYLIRWIAYAAIFFVVNDLSPKNKKKIIWFLLIDGVIIEIAGFIQYFLYPSLRNLYYLGWDEHLFRIFSTFLDPNFAGAFFVLYFIFVAGLLFDARKKRNKKQTIFFGSILVITLLSLFLTFSRSALIMLLVSTGVFLTLIRRKRLIFILLGLLILGFVAVSPFFYIENLNLFRTASSNARLGTYGNALKIIEDRPVFGVGFDAYRYAQIAYHFRSETPKFPSHADAGVDNSFLFAFATTGIVGLIAFSYFWRRLLQLAITAFRKRGDIFALISISSAIGLFIDAFFINSLFYPLLLLWIWIMWGLIGNR